MMARVYVSLKKSVADPQGQTIKKALNDIGYEGVAEVRVGKFFDISYDGDLENLERVLKEISEKVLANPVIEEFVIEESA
ncbi:MAG: phosphoribosylformylglycinamidine synthase subunit PurS [candidate division Zixibacteria bacterium]|nr:phosphoribosylformylglycinamidine synthase subunit PurS [candidate division Zixibacteria bacterium]